MTGKEMLVVLGGAAALGAGAGTAAAYLRDVPAMNAPRPAPVPNLDVAVLERLESMEKRLAEARAALDEARAAIRAVETRAEEAATAAEQARAAAATLPLLPASASSLDGSTSFEAALEDGKDGLAVGDGEGRVMRFRLGDGKDGEAPRAAMIALQDISGELKGLGDGLRLRMKPEAERWAKAKEDLNLSDAQVRDLQAAVADRDRAMSDAMVTEKRSVGDSGEEVTVKRLDGEKAHQIQKDHRDRVGGILTDEQNKGWKDKGYDHAFGSSPGIGLGGSGHQTIMAVESSSQWLHGGASESTEK